MGTQCQNNTRLFLMQNLVTNEAEAGSGGLRTILGQFLAWAGWKNAGMSMLNEQYSFILRD